LSCASATGQGASLVDGSGTQTEVQLFEALAKIRGAALPRAFEVTSSVDADAGKTYVERASGATPATMRIKVP
jgi:hypothetical protein